MSLSDPLLNFPLSFLLKMYTLQFCEAGLNLAHTGAQICKAKPLGLLTWTSVVLILDFYTSASS
jgi:hypothetical protein